MEVRTLERKVGCKEGQKKGKRVEMKNVRM